MKMWGGNALSQKLILPERVNFLFLALCYLKFNGVKSNLQ